MQPSRRLFFPPSGGPHLIRLRGVARAAFEHCAACDRATAARLTSLTQLLLVNAAVVSAAAVLQWLWSLRARDVTVADVYWGFGFVIVAWLSFVMAGTASVRAWLLVVLTSLWGVRLGSYLLWRGRDQPEDPRYRKIRERHGKSFPMMSLFVIFGFQGGVLLVVSLPVQVGMLATGAPDPALWAGVLVWLIGFVFEAIGDRQLSRFRANPDNRGKVMNRGLWRYTRHPNYFGDFMVWWGLFLIALDSVDRLWIAAGPALMSVMLLRVSGVSLLEKTLSQREGYAEYIETTSAFIPWPPKRKVD